MAGLAKYRDRLYRVKWLGTVQYGEFKGKKRAHLVPLDKGSEVWVGGEEFTFVEYVPKGERGKGK
jgi:hypothetical protein